MSDSDHLLKGDLIKSRWRIIHKIGSGGFGQIYQAYDKLRQELVAVKVESNSQARQGIRMEVTVLRRIQNRQHICELYSAGISSLYNYMVMTLLGSSLSELRRNLSEQCFTLSTSLRISLQILDAIESIHSIGFLHRDIKPSNFAIGKQNCRRIFILDFGLARKYTDYNQHVRPARAEAGFRGTIRYASINAHNNRELGRHDDLWSFFYMLVEFLIGSLPWSKIKDKESVGHMKETYDYTRFLTYLPDEFNKFLGHLHELHYEDKPNYDFLRSLFISAIERLGYQDNDPYDWEKSTEQDQTDSLIKLEPQIDHQRKTIPGNHSLHHQQSPSRSPGSNRQLIKSSSRTDLLRKITKHYSHQQSPYGFDRLKLDSIDTGDQQLINNPGKTSSSQLENHSPDTLARRSTHINIIDHGQAASNGLLTYVSQQFSNAAVAPGTPSVFSQWSPHNNGETFTDDDILKGNKSNSSRADERITTLSGERTNNYHSSRRITQTVNRKLETISNNEGFYLPPKHQSSIEQNLPLPFGTYIKTSRTNNYSYDRRSTSSRKKV